MRNQLLLPTVASLKTPLFLLTFLALFYHTSQGQVSSYHFSQASGTYTSITGTQLGRSVFDDSISTITIPTFHFNGTAYTKLYVSTNGWVGLRASGTVTGGTVYTAISSTTTADGIIAPFARDLNNALTGSPSVSWGISGTEIVVQWRDVHRYSTTASEKFSVQARLDTISGVIKFVYTAVTGGSTSTGVPQIGLRGATNADYNDRALSTGSPWTSTTAGTSNASTVAFDSATATYPTAGMTFIYTPATCFPPTALTATSITATSATLSWTAPTQGTPAGYLWEVVVSGAGPYATPVASNYFVGTGTTVSTGSGLTAATIYDAYVKTGCSLTDTSTWSAVATFTTSCPIISALPWTEGFEGIANPTTGVFPACWSTQNLAGTNLPGSDNGTIVDTTQYGGPHTGSNFLYSQWDNTAWVFTPAFQLTAGTSYDFSFYMENFDFTGAGDFVMDVAYGSSATDAGMTHALITGNQCTNSSYQQFTSTFTPATSGVYYFGVKSTSTNLNPWYLSFDDFALQLTPSCSAPNGLTAGTLVSTGGTISWSSTPAGQTNGYTWKVVASGAGSTGTALASGTTAAGVNTATITGLTASTTYDFYVQSNCGGATTSLLAGPLPFTTPCSAITSIPWTEGFEGVSSPGAGVFPPCWSSVLLSGSDQPGTDDGSQTFDGEPRTGTNFMYSTYNNSSWVFTPGFQLTAGTYYDFSFYMENKYVYHPGDYLMDVAVGTAATDAGMTHALITANPCSNNTYQKFTSTFSPSVTGVYYFGVKSTGTNFNADELSYDDFSLTLTPACSVPNGLVAGTPTLVGGTAVWSQTPTGATNGYNWKVVAPGAGSTGTAIASGTTAAVVDSVVITSLSASTSYDFYVQARCGGSSVSAFAGPLTLNTQCGPISSIPWTEGFEGMTTVGAGVFPLCWSTENLAGTDIPGSDDGSNIFSGDGGPHAGTHFLYSQYDNTAWIFTPGFQLTGGTSYDFSFFMENLNPSSPIDFVMDVAYGTTASDAGMTNSLISGYSPTNTSYQRFLSTFTPATSGVYYFGVKSTSLTFDPYYLSYDDFAVQLTPACTGFPDSLSISGITSISAIAKWTAATPLPASGYSWEVVAANAGPSATAVATGTTILAVDSAIIAGLAPNTAYDFYVRSNCGGASGFGSWTGPQSFTTYCGNSTLPLIEGFNGTTIPSCWSQDHVVGSMDLQYVASSTLPTTTPQEGTDFVLWNSENSYEEDTRLVSPPITTTGTPSVDVQFYWFNENSTFANSGLFLTEGVTVQYSLDRVTWNDVQFYPRQDNSLSPGSGQWKKKTLTLPLAVGNQSTVFVGFKFHSELGDNCSLDNINIFHSLPCAGAPTAVTVSNLTTTTASLSWTADPTPPAGGYNWKVVAAGDSATGTPIASGSTAAGLTTASVSGLTANTPYTVYVESNCGGANGVGYWSVPVDFSTPCNAITSLPWTEGFEGVTNPGADVLPPCWLGTPAGRWYTANAPLGIGSLGPRVGNNYLYNAYDANDTIFTPGFALTGGTQYEFYFYYQTDGYTGWDSIYTMYGNSQTQSGMTTLTGSPVLGPTNAGYARYSAIFTPATSGTYYMGMKLEASGNPYNIAFDDFGLHAVVPCPNPPAGGTVSGPTSVCVNSAANLALTGYSPFTTLQWQTSIDSINFVDIPSANSDAYTDFVSNLTYYRVRVSCADTTYSSIFTVGLKDASQCYCTVGIGGTCGNQNIDTVAIAGTNFFVTDSTCHTTSSGDAYTVWPQSGNSTTTLQRGGTYTLTVRTKGSTITSAWIDYDHSGTFDGTTAVGQEWVQVNLTGKGGVVTITVPAGAYLGPVGFRIRTRASGSFNDSTSACDNFFSGDAFDFVINIADTACTHTPTVVDTVSNVTCNGSANGSISISVSGGLPPFTHSWSSGDATSSISGLSGGTYTDTISFHYGCTYIPAPIAVTEPRVLSPVTDSIIPVKCLGASSGAIYVSVTGGTSTYAHHWSNGSTADPLTGVAAGVYRDTVTDSHGCKAILGPDTITHPATAVAVTVDSTHAVKCNGGNTGAAYITVSGGTGPYTYLWSNASHATTQDVTGLGGGQYTVVVTDHNLCTVTATDSVPQPSAITIRTDSIISTKCHNTSDGSIYVTVTGGTLPYVYAWSNGGGASLDVFFKPAGAYTLSVTDRNQCVVTATDTIKAPATISISSTINNQIQGGALGSIALSVSGGTAPYKYHWASGDSTATLSNLTSGVYTATVTDLNGCTATVRDTVDRVTSIIEAAGDIKAFSIYPNPSTAVFNVVLQLSHILPVKMEVYSIAGQLIPVSAVESPLNDTYQLDLSAQAEGVYFVKVTAGDNSLIKKITVVR